MSGFQQYYRCHPITGLKGPDRSSNNYGGKIILPQSALHKLTMLHISYPMLFEIRNGDTGQKTHAGVLEFTAEEGRAYLPQWMLDTLKLGPGSLVKITNVSLALGSLVKLEPQSVDFLEITDPRAVLENALRNFSTLSVDDIFQISYNNHIYAIRVLEAKPETDYGGVSIVETDLEVDFAPPVGYVEPDYTKPSGTPDAAGGITTIGPMAKEIGYAKLALADQGSRGAGNRMNGKAIEDQTADKSQDVVTTAIYKNYSAPPLDLPEGQLFFGFPYYGADEHDTGADDNFKGEGDRLRKSKKRKDIE